MQIESIREASQIFNCMQPDALIKLVLIGATNCGKTSLMLRFIDNVFNEGQTNTIGVDFKMKSLRIDDKIVKV